MQPADFKDKEQEVAEEAKIMVRDGKGYDLKDLLDDELGELRMRYLARAKAEKTAETALHCQRSIETIVGEGGGAGRTKGT